MPMAFTDIEFGKACFTHCCPRHGCKYSYDSWAANGGKVCPISEGQAQPVYPRNNGCEQCAPEFDAVAAAYKTAQTWNVCDPETNITAEAAKQIALAAISAYTKAGDWSVD